VEAILGLPGDYATVPFENGSGVEVDPSDVYSKVVRTFSAGECWCGNDCLIFIAFDGSNGRVVGSSFMQPRKLDQSPVDNLLWRAKRQWHRWFPE
jgi:hypothetical protein